MVLLTLPVAFADFATLSMKSSSCQTIAAFATIELGKNATSIRLLVDVVQLIERFGDATQLDNLSQRILNETDEEQRQDLIASIRRGSVVAWKHINLHGEYDFSQEKLEDSVGLEVPKIRQLTVV